MSHKPYARGGILFIAICLLGLYIWQLAENDSKRDQLAVYECLVQRRWEDGSIRGYDAEVATACLRGAGLLDNYLEQFK